MRRRKPRQHRSRASQQLFIHHSGLRKVRNLRRPAKVHRRRKQVILHHRTQQHVGAELLRMRRNPLQHLLPPHPLRPHHESVACAVQHRAPVALHRKQQRRVRRHPHLLVIARPVQCLAPLQQRLVQFLGALGRRRKQRLRNGVQLIVQRIHQHQPAPAQQPRKQPRKRRTVALTRRDSSRAAHRSPIPAPATAPPAPPGPQSVASSGSGPTGASDPVCSLAVSFSSSHPLGRVALAISARSWSSVASQKIAIAGVPCAVSSSAICMRRNRLQHRVQRPAQHSHLLPADAGHRSLAEAFNRGHCRLRCAPAPVLLLQHVGHPRPPFRRKLQLPRVAPAPPASAAGARKTPSPSHTGKENPGTAASYAESP